jgi:hypothetical protein
VNGDAISDLVLVLVCVLLLLRNARLRPGIAYACAGVGCAAATGVLHLSGFAAASGPHRFFTLMASCTALPLLADAMIWPNGEPARTRRGAALFLFMSSLVAIVLVIGLKLALWLQIVPGLAALGILYGSLQNRRPPAIVGALILVASFGMLVLGVPLRPLSQAELLHYAMAVALLLIGI